MPTFNITPGAFGVATVTGTRPFAAKQSGGEGGAVDIVDATGAITNPKINGETAGSTFAETDRGQAFADAVVTAANNSPLNTVAPVITGTAQVGQVLTTTGGTWTGTGAPAKTYQWKANGVVIANATATTYTPVVGDIGKTITVTVTGTNTSGAGSVTSAATAAVVAA